MKKGRAGILVFIGVFLVMMLATTAVSITLAGVLDGGGRDPYIIARLIESFQTEGRPLASSDEEIKIISDRTGEFWGTYYSGDPIFKGSFLLENRGREPYGFALWAQHHELLPFPQGALEVTDLTVSKLLEEGRFGVLEILSSPNDLILRPGEIYKVEYRFKVADYAKSATVSGIDIRINHLRACEVEGEIRLCPGR